MTKERESIDEMIDAHLWMRAVEKRREKRRRRAMQESQRAAPAKGPKSPAGFSLVTTYTRGACEVELL
jgi:hypothetical protein